MTDRQMADAVEAALANKWKCDVCSSQRWERPKSAHIVHAVGLSNGTMARGTTDMCSQCFIDWAATGVNFGKWVLDRRRRLHEAAQNTKQAGKSPAGRP